MRNTFLALACVVLSHEAIAQNLPDEINHAPYYNSYLEIRSDRDETQASLQMQNSQLANILAAIDDKYDYIATLEIQNRDAADRISYLERELPAKTNDLRSSEGDLSYTEGTISSLDRDFRDEARRLERVQRELAPIQGEMRQLGAEITRQMQRVQRLNRERDGHKNSMEKAKNEIVSLEQKARSLNAQAQQTQAKEPALRSQVSSLSSEVSSLERQVGQLNSQIQALGPKVKQLHAEVTQAQQELARLKRSGASAAEISAQQSKVSALAQKHRAAGSELSALAMKKRGIDSKIITSKRNLANAQKELAAIPGKVAALRAQAQQSIQKVPGLQKQIQEGTTQVARLNQEIGKMETNISNIQRRQNQLRPEESRLQARINNISERMRRLENQLAAEQSRASALRNRISSLRNEIQNIRQELPELERNIAYNQSEISTSRADISDLSGRERDVRADIGSLETRLAALEQETEAALNQYQRRFDLYNSYLAQAKSLGEEQTDGADALGSQKGLELAANISSELANVHGQEEGKAQAKLIGLVRGENEGYQLGYAAGEISADSIQAGEVKGKANGKEAAYQFVEANFKAGYFERHMQELLKLPVGARKKSSREKSVRMSLGRANMVDLEAQKVHAFAAAGLVPDLSGYELERSRSVKTPLDGSVESALGEVKKLQGRFEEFKNPAMAYTQPTSVPYGQVNCAGIYKGVVEYAQACQASFKKLFGQRFMAKTYESFSGSFTNAYSSKYAEREAMVRDASYQAEFDKAHAVAFNKGEADGKKDAYDQAYSKAYELAYASNIEPAKQAADQEAQRESHEWIASHPILTVQSHRVSSKNLRGGSKGQLLIDLKNISSVSSMVSGVMKIESSSNLKFAKSAYPIGEVRAKGLSTLAIPFTVSAEARSGQELRALVKLELPGDKYQAQRVEKAQFAQALALNPKYGADLNYDQSPKVKGMFSYYVHTFSATVMPVVENLDSTYEVTLSVAPEQQNLITFKTSKLKTGVLGVNQGQKLDFSYVFNTAARGKKVVLKLEVFYKGESVGFQTMELQPH